MIKALKHFTTEQIEDYTMGDDDCLTELLKEAIEAAKKAPDGTATVQFFVNFEENEDEDKEPTP